MSKDLYVQDTAEVFITSLVTGNIVGVGYAQVAGIEQTTEETEIRGGIGNKLAYVIKSSKDIALNITSATFKPEFFEITQGVTYENNVTRTFTKNLFAKVASGVNGLEIKLPDDLNNLTTVRITDTDGEQQDVVATTGIVELPTGFSAQEGDELEVFYFKEVTGRSFDFDATKFGTKYKVEMNTLCYDRDTDAPYSNIYFEFPETTPSGNFSMNLQNGEAYIPELNFKVTASRNSSVLGTKFEELL